MKAGDYVRTDTLGIWKLEFVRTQAKKYTHHLIKQYNGFTIFRDIEEKRIVKSSPNIIDLIEENDFVKIEYFSNRYEKRVTRWFEVDYALNGDFCFENGYCRLNILNGKWSRQDELLTPIIKSIVTKEMYSSVEYRVENN